MFHVILFNPEIPPNTGNIIRLCANSGTKLHLIKPLGFNLNNTNLRRANMDYEEIQNINLYENVDECFKNNEFNDIFALTKYAKKNAFSKKFLPNDAFIFGSETAGLPKDLLKNISNDKKIRIPMLENIRSINLSNSVSIIIYEAWRQNNFFKAQEHFEKN